VIETPQLDSPTGTGTRADSRSGSPRQGGDASRSDGFRSGGPSRERSGTLSCQTELSDGTGPNRVTPRAPAATPGALPGTCHVRWPVPIPAVADPHAPCSPGLPPSTADSNRAGDPSQGRGPPRVGVGPRCWCDPSVPLSGATAGSAVGVMFGGVSASGQPPRPAGFPPESAAGGPVGIQGTGGITG